MRIGPGQRAAIAMLVLAGGISTVTTFGLEDVYAQTASTFRDRFSSISYSGNDGSEAFSGPWRERGETDGATAGVVQVVQDVRCSGGTGNCLRIGADGADIDGHSIDRTADVDGAQDATLRLFWRRRTQGQIDGTLRIRVSGNGGGSWTTLATIPFAGSQGTNTEIFDVTSFATSEFVVRFEGAGSGVNGYVLVDDVEIEAALAVGTTTTTTGATTTTTTATTTTTTVPGVTTTTNPVTTTTTTTVPGVTTTTNPVTTTTIPGVTPTTIPGVTPTTIPGVTPTTTATSTTTTVSDTVAPLGGDTPPSTDLPAPTAPETTLSANSRDVATSVAPSPTGGATSSDESIDALANAESRDASAVPSPIVLLAAQISLLGLVIGSLAFIGVASGRADS